MENNKSINEAISHEQEKLFNKKIDKAISYLAATNLSAFASLLRVGKIEITQDNEKFATAALVKSRTSDVYKIVFNYNFCNQFNEKALAGILFHELLHHIMRHLEREEFSNHQLANIVYDAFINRTIYKIEPSLIAFAKEMYSPNNSPELFLRPNSKPIDPIDKQIYRHLYNGMISETDLYNYLERKLNIETINILLVGSGIGNGESDIDAEDVPGLMRDVIDKLEQEDKTGTIAGKYNKLLDDFIRVNKLGKEQSIEEAFKVSITDSIKSQILTETLGNVNEHGSQSVLMPHYPARTDVIQAGMGLPILFWRNPYYGHKDGDVKVYVDVSGSVDSYKDWIYGIILAFEEYLHTNIYLFSNEIAEISIGDFKNGVVKTTGGTDFNCIAEHVLENKYEKIIIFTDGYASMNDTNKKNLKEAKTEIISVIIGERGNYYTDGIKNFSKKVFNLPLKRD